MDRSQTERKQWPVDFFFTIGNFRRTFNEDERLGRDYTAVNYARDHRR